MFVVKVPHAEQEPGTSSGIHLINPSISTTNINVFDRFMTCDDGHMVKDSEDPHGHICDVCKISLETFMRQDTKRKWHARKWSWCEGCNWCVCPECKEVIGFAIQFDNSIYEVHENFFVKGLRSTKRLIMFHMEAPSDNVFVLEDKPTRLRGASAGDTWLCKKTSMALNKTKKGALSTKHTGIVTTQNVKGIK